ncbi:hypothetical protein [Oceaniferula marina]|uniref:hypothetical protein n=1 Tax=Oceaniferula marina TaxID=2748318 RepID=UPI001D0469BA|nr:hypothetical protein [Oceaniferula marina]
MSRVDGPCLLYGSVGVWLAVAMELVGLFKAGDRKLLDALMSPVFHGQAPSQWPLWMQILITAACCYALAFFVLDSHGTWRRVLLGVTMLILVLSMVPTMAVWEVYFSPFLPAVGVFWTWFCSMMYVRHHVMPCDAAHAAVVPQSILEVSSAYKTPTQAPADASEKVVTTPELAQSECSDIPSVQAAMAVEKVDESEVFQEHLEVKKNKKPGDGKHPDRVNEKDALAKYRPRDLDRQAVKGGANG